MHCEKNGANWLEKKFIYPSVAALKYVCTQLYDTARFS